MNSHIFTNKNGNIQTSFVNELYKERIGKPAVNNRSCCKIS